MKKEALLTFALSLSLVAPRGAVSAESASRMDRTKLQIGTYCLASYARSEAHVRAVKDCGIDFIYGIPASDRRTLDLCAKYGLGVIATGAVPFWHGMGGEQAGQMKTRRPLAGYETAMAAYADHPAVWMLDYVDEPSALDFPWIAEVTKLMQAKSPKGVVPYINLYPNYASAVGNTAKQTVNQLGTKTYAEHVAAYMKSVPLDYVCFDFYLYSARGEKARRAKLGQFHENFRDLADACRATGKSLWYIPQVNSSYGELWLSENMLRFQANLALAYGAEQINWACWSREAAGETADMPGLTGWWTNNVLTLSGEVTEQYAKLRTVNAELRRLGDRYMKYRNVMTRRTEKDAFVVGDMVARDGSGRRALFVLAAADPFDEHPAKQRFVFPAAAAKAFGGNGELPLEKAGEGQFALTLDANAGALVEFTPTREPKWVLNPGPTTVRTHISDGSAEAAFGLYRINVTGTDLTFTIPQGADEAFPAGAYPYFALRYRIRSRVSTCGLFFATDTLREITGESYSHFRIQPDGQWHNAVVDMRTLKPGLWKGEVRRFRLDPTNPSEPGDVDEISRLGFFASRAAADAFLSAADDSEDYSRDLFLRGRLFKAIVPGGTASAGWKESDYRLRDESVPAGEGKLTVCCDGEPVPCHVNSRGFAFYLAAKPGEYRFARVEAAKVRPLDKASADKLGCGISANAKPASHFTRERIRIGGWGLHRGIWNRQSVSDFAACGLDFLVANSSDSGSDAGKLLSACDEEGIEVCLNDGRALTDPEHAGLEFADHPSLCGFYLTDEPGTDAYDKWGGIAKTCRERTGKRPFINLLPMYANAAQLKFGAGAAAIEYYDPDPNLFRKYCESYCDKVPTDYVCTDIYPLFWRGKEMYTYRDYIESINVIASVARERNREFWCCIQTFGWNRSKRTPNAAEYRWQCYSLLSFGCRALLCWVYVGYDPAFPSLVTCDGERTAAWYDAQTVFREIKAISDVYCTYRNLGAYTHNCTDETPYLKMTGEYRGFGTIRRIDCSAPLLVGCFERKAGAGKAFTLVNMNDFACWRSALAKLDIAGERVTVYRRGVPERIERGADGLYAIPLECGEGVFVTVD